MKKLFFAVLTTLMAFAANAQSAKKGDVNLGVSAGVGMSNIKFNADEFPKQSPRLHYQLGFVVDYALADNFYLESGLVGQVKGLKHSFIEPVYDHNQEIVGTLTEDVKVINVYGSIPLLVAYKFNLSDKVSLAPQFGPMFNVMIADINRIKLGNGYSQTSEIGEPTFDLSLRLAANLGLGDKARISVGYDQGVTDVYDYRKSKSNTLFAGFTYYFK